MPGAALPREHSQGDTVKLLRPLLCAEHPHDAGLPRNIEQICQRFQLAVRLETQAVEGRLHGRSLTIAWVNRTRIQMFGDHTSHRIHDVLQPESEPW